VVVCIAMVQGMREGWPL